MFYQIVEFLNNKRLLLNQTLACTTKKLKLQKNGCTYESHMQKYM